MITIKSTGKAGETVRPLTIEELAAGIAASLEKTGGVISGDRKDSVESHLRTCIGTLGYKPREKVVEGKKVTPVTELLRQLLACLDDTTEVTQDQHDHLHLHLRATNSNCAAEVGAKAVPELKEAPALKEAPTGANPQQLQQQNSNPDGNALMALKYQDLLKQVDEFNADPAHTEKITVPGNSSKLSLVNLILKAKGLPTFILLFLCMMLFGNQANAMVESFQFTNIVPALLPITSYPTNTQTTNLWSAGVTAVTTNQYYLGYLTGKGINIQNYNSVDFVFSANYTSSNNSVLAFGLVRGAGPADKGGTPVMLINTNTSTVWSSGWETAVAPQDWVLVPLPAGTNLAINWRTNLYIYNADYVGVYQETNNISGGAGGGGIGWASNIVVGVNKKILPFSFSSGNW